MPKQITDKQAEEKSDNFMNVKFGDKWSKIELPDEPQEEVKEKRTLNLQLPILLILIAMFAYVVWALPTNLNVDKVNTASEYIVDGFE